MSLTGALQTGLGISSSKRGGRRVAPSGNVKFVLVVLLVGWLAGKSTLCFTLFVALATALGVLSMLPQLGSAQDAARSERRHRRSGTSSRTSSGSASSPRRRYVATAQSTGSAVSAGDDGAAASDDDVASQGSRWVAMLAITSVYRIAHPLTLHQVGLVINIISGVAQIAQQWKQ